MVGEAVIERAKGKIVSQSIVHGGKTHCASLEWEPHVSKWFVVISRGKGREGSRGSVCGEGSSRSV